MDEPNPGTDLQNFLSWFRTKRSIESHLTIMRLSNGYLVPWPLFLEPWGAKVDLVAGADYDVVAYGSTADHDRLVYDEQRGDWFTVQVEDAGVAIYVSIMTVGLAVFCEGRSVWMWPPSGRAETPSSSAF